MKLKVDEAERDTNFCRKSSLNHGLSFSRVTEAE